MWLYRFIKVKKASKPRCLPPKEESAAPETAPPMPAFLLFCATTTTINKIDTITSTIIKKFVTTVILPVMLDASPIHDVLNTSLIYVLLFVTHYQ